MRPPCAAVRHPAALPLSRAALCLDCESIFPIDACVCPACGSTAVFLLALWVNRVAA